MIPLCRHGEDCSTCLECEYGPPKTPAPCSHPRISMDVGIYDDSGQMCCLDWCLDCGALRMRDALEPLANAWALPTAATQPTQPQSQ